MLLTSPVTISQICGADRSQGSDLISQLLSCCVGSEGQRLECPWGLSEGSGAPHFTWGDEGWSQTAAVGVFLHVCVCVCVHLSVRAGAECFVLKARRAPVSPLAPGTAGFGFLSRAGQRGQPFAETSALSGRSSSH